MNASQILIAIVAVLTVSVLALIVVVMRQRRGAPSGPTEGPVAALESVLMKNASDGNIQVVARKVSDLLIKECHCDRIVFLRRKRGALALNYYHGITRFNRRDFNLKFSDELASELSTTISPRPLSEISHLLPHNYIQLLAHHEVDYVLPVFWRENFYGCYFLKTTAPDSVNSVGPICAVAAHSLAAAYHVKWHESRLASLAATSASDSSSGVTEGRPRAVIDIGERMVELLRHRTPSEIIPRILHNIRDEFGMTRIAYFYHNSTKDEKPRIASFGIDSQHPQPSTSTLRSIDGTLTGEQVLAVEKLIDHDSESVQSFGAELSAAGLTHIVPFRLYREGHGLIAFTGPSLSPQTVRRLRDFRSTAESFVENAALHERLQELSFTDNLTGLANQRYFVKRLGEEILRASRYARELALIIFDLDDLKYVNDNHGHLAGDAVLRQLGGVLRGTTRTIDVVARYGGDEFCVIMPEADKQTCLGFMERLQGIIAETEFHVEDTQNALRCTISLGAAIYPGHADNSRDLIHVADIALLKAKEGGRNRFLIHTAETA